MSTARKALSAAGVVAFLIIGKMAADATEPARASVALNAVTPQSVAVTPTPRPLDNKVQVAASIAVFRKGHLEQCIDVDYTATFLLPDAGRPDPGKITKFADELTKSFIKTGLDKGQTVTKLTQTCAAQFPDRTVLATCVETDQKSDQKGSLNFTGRTGFYLFASVFGDDREMQTCLTEGGQWKAISRDSPEYRRAKHEATIAQATKYLDQASELAAQPTQ